ncbi:MAG: electron transport complex protein RnfG [Osedax symbiont Rs1]|nr:MAG: electron transport complex protein RnfG [Osedax symbiont Rs1]
MNMSQSLRVNAVGIGIFAGITAAMIAITFVLTKAPIADNIRQQKSAKLFEIIGDSQIDNDIFSDTITLPGAAFGYEQEILAHRASFKGQLTSLVFPVITARGYSGNISLLVGINIDGSVAGVRVISHRETPGLGDKLELKKSAWLLIFNGKTKHNAADWAVKKDGGQFDQFTGATITPRAVVNAVGQALDYFSTNKTALLAEQNAGPKNSGN